MHMRRTSTSNSGLGIILAYISSTFSDNQVSYLPFLKEDGFPFFCRTINSGCQVFSKTTLRNSVLPIPTIRL